MRTAVVTDSTARPVPAAADVVDLDVVVAGEPVREVDTDLDGLLAQMAAGTAVGTSRPSPEGFEAAYRRAGDRGASAVVSVHLSGALSGTVEAARLAAAAVPLRVDVVDTTAVGAVLSAAVAAACALAADGADATRVARLARAVGEGSSTWFSPATAAHLQRGGRGGDPPPGRLLTARHVLVVEDGRLVPLERARTTGRVLDRLDELVAARLDELRLRGGPAGAVLGSPSGAASVEVVVQHAGAPEQAVALVDRLRRRLRSASDPVVRTQALSPVLAAHVGPGAVGVAVVVVPAHA